MTNPRDDKKTRSIQRSLEQTTKELQSSKAALEHASKAAQSRTEHIEQRLQAIQKELDQVSDKMLAYKLRRLAGSKMLATVSRQAKPESDVKRKTKGVKSSGKDKATPYSSPTFRCKSDLDLCLTGSRSALDKALCYALFIRCAIKG